MENQIQWEQLLKNDPSLINSYIENLQKFNKVLDKTAQTYEEKSKQFQKASKNMLEGLEEIEGKLKSSFKGNATEKETKAAINLALAIEKAKVESQKYAVQSEKLRQQQEQLIETENKAKKVKEDQIKLNNAVGDSTVALKNQLSNLQKEYDQLSKAERENVNVGGDLVKRIGNLKQELEGIRKPIKDSAKGIEEVEGSYTQLTRQTSLLIKELKNLPDAFDQTSPAVQRLTKQITENQNKLKAFDASLGNFQRNVGNYKSAFDGLGGSLSGVGGGIGTLSNIATAAVTGGVAGLASALTGALVDGAVQLAETLKETNKQLRDTSNLLGLTGDQAVFVASQIKTTSYVFGDDFNEVLLSTNALVKNFGIDALTAGELIRKGLASGANISGEFLDSIREYSVLLKDIGFTAEQTIALGIEQGKNGLFSDKLIDSIKEINLRLGDLNPTQQKVLDGLGAVGIEIQKTFATDKPKAIALLANEIIRLEKAGKNVTPIIANLGGGPLEDLGLKGIKALAGISGLRIELTKSQQTQVDYAIAVQKSNDELFKLTNTVSGTSSDFAVLLEKAKAFGLFLVNNLIGQFIKYKEEVGLLAKEFEPVINAIKEFFAGGKEANSVFSDLFGTLFSIVSEINIIGFIKLMVAGFEAINVGISVAKGSLGDFASGFDSLLNLDFEKAKSYFKSGFEDVANASKAAFEEKYKSLTFDTATLDIQAEEKQAEEAAKKAVEAKKKVNEKARKEAQELAKRNNEAEFEIDKLLLERQIKANERLLENDKLTAEQQIEIVKMNAKLEQKINELTLQNDLEKSKLTSKEKLKIQEQYVDRVIESENKLADSLKAIKEKSLQDTADLIAKFGAEAEAKNTETADAAREQLNKEVDDIFKQLEADNERELKLLEEKEEKKKALIQATFDFASDLGNAGFDLYSQRLENELTTLNEQKERELNLEGITEEQKGLITEKFAAKEAELKRKQAIADKAQALFNIAIQTAQAVATAVAASPITFGLPFSAFALATGVVQAGLVLAQPIPKFRKGTDKLKKGDGLQGSDSDGMIIEAHEGEMIVPKNVLQETGISSVSELAQLAQYYKDYERTNDTMLEAKKNNSNVVNSYERSERIVNENIKKNNVSLEIKSDGFTVKENSNEIEFKNRRFKWNRNY
jgi:hypothetical protein